MIISNTAATTAAIDVLREAEWKVSYNSVKAALEAAIPHLIDTGQSPDCGQVVGRPVTETCDCGHMIGLHRRRDDVVVCDPCLIQSEQTSPNTTPAPVEARLDGLIDVVLRQEQRAVEQSASAERIHQAQLEGIVDKLDRLTDLIVDSREETESSAADIRVDAAYQRGRTEQEARDLQRIDCVLETTSPSDYEVWRDALLIAAQTVEVKGDVDEVVYVARNLVGTLRRAGARIDGDPADDFAPDDVLSFIEPDEDADDDEDCPNCGTDDDEHEEGCPKDDQAETDFVEAEGERVAQERFEQGFGTYPGHDMSVTTGGCGPEHPCPACRQRIQLAADTDPPATFPGVNPDGTGTGEWSGRAGG